MKFVKAALWCIPALALTGTVIAMFFLPERIPIQVNISGEYSNFGSKFMLFIFPVITFLFPVSHGSQNGKFSRISPWLVLIFELILLGVEIFAISMGLNYK